jgi:hypothetical protein
MGLDGLVSVLHLLVSVLDLLLDEQDLVHPPDFFRARIKGLEVLVIITLVGKIIL